MGAVIVVIHGGVAEYIATGDVKVVIVDYDNLEDEDASLETLTEVVNEMKSLPEGDEDWNVYRDQILDDLEEISDSFEA